MTSKIVIRPPEISERNSILEIVEQAFGDEPVAPIVETLWRENAVSLEFVAIDDGELSGYCAVSGITSAPHIDGHPLALSPVAVSPHRQKKGIGTALCRQIVNVCEADGTPLLVVLGHKEYYPRFGFKPAVAQGIRWTERDAGDSFMAIDFKGVGQTPRAVKFHPAFD